MPFGHRLVVRALRLHAPTPRLMWAVLDRGNRFSYGASYALDAFCVGRRCDPRVEVVRSQAYRQLRCVRAATTPLQPRACASVLLVCKPAFTANLNSLASTCPFSHLCTGMVAFIHCSNPMTCLLTIRSAAMLEPRSTGLERGLVAGSAAQPWRDQRTGDWCCALVGRAGIGRARFYPRAERNRPCA